MLCKTCTAMFQSSDWGSHHPDSSALSSAAASGCYICEPMLKYAMTKYGALENCVAEPYMYRVFAEETPQLIIDMKVLDDGKVAKEYRTFMAVQPSTLGGTETGVRGRRQIPLEKATGTARGWLKECLAEHEMCGNATAPQWYPTRLLRLQDSTVNLISTKNNMPTGPYAALSYCWGDDPDFLRLTASNLHDLQAGIPYSALPIAFQEALRILRDLFLHFVWIDCLCIIQSGPGSTKDWQYECGKMHDVYSNCILNLSLARTKSPQQSCLGGYDYDTVLPFGVETTGWVPDAPLEKRTFTMLSWHYFREGLYDQPLEYRAWCLQERLLAPRVLSVGHGEFYWDCVRLPHASESLPRGLLNISDPEFSVCLDRYQMSIPNTFDRTVMEKFWVTIVEEYSRRSLTHPRTDKLIALSAIAARVGHAMDDVYIAGHFWKTLPHSLNWLACFPYTESPRRDKVSRRLNRLRSSLDCKSRSKTPSWSWASMDGPVNPNQIPSKEHSATLVEVEDFTLRLTDEANPTGQVDYAVLTMKARPIEIGWRMQMPLFTETSGVWKDHEVSLMVYIDDADDQPVDGAKSLLVPLLVTLGLEYAVGLVLEAVEMEGKGVYERIGHFRLDQKYKQVGPTHWSTGEDSLLSLLEKGERKALKLV